jgi:hypothetical protein
MATRDRQRNGSILQLGVIIDAADSLTGMVSAFVNQGAHLSRFYGRRIRDEDANSICAYKQLVRKNHNARVPLYLFALAVSRAIGDYTHEDEAIQEAGRQAWARLSSPAPGCNPTTHKDFAQSVTISALAYGSCFSEKSYKVVGPKATIDQLSIWDRQLFYYSVEDSILHAQRRREGVSVDLKQGFHFAAHYEFNPGNPNGISALESAIESDKLIVIAQRALAMWAKYAVLPILVGKTDGSAQVEDPDQIDPLTKKPMLVSAFKGMRNMLKKLQSSAAVVIGRDDSIEPLSQEIDANGLLAIINQCERDILKSVFTPQTLIDSNGSGSGDSGLVKGHKEFYMSVVLAYAQTITRQMVEQIMWPMEKFNYGDTGIRGYFPVMSLSEALRDDNISALLDSMSNMIELGQIDGKDDAVIDRVRHLIGY